MSEEVPVRKGFLNEESQRGKNVSKYVESYNVSCRGVDLVPGVTVISVERWFQFGTLGR